MRKGKVYCSNCRHLIHSLTGYISDAYCQIKEQVKTKSDYYQPEHYCHKISLPKIKNKHNDCPDYDQRPKGIFERIFG